MEKMWMCMGMTEMNDDDERVGSQRKGNTDDDSMRDNTGTSLKFSGWVKGAEVGINPEVGIEMNLDDKNKNPPACESKVSTEEAHGAVFISSL